MFFRSLLQLRDLVSLFTVVSIGVALGVAACGSDGASSPSEPIDAATADVTSDSTPTGEAGSGGTPADDAQSDADASDAAPPDVSGDMGDGGSDVSSDAGSSSDVAADADGRATQVDAKVVDASADTTAPPVDAAAEAGGEPMSYPGDTCEDAMVIGPGHYTGQVAVGYTSNYGVAGCDAKNGLPDRVYSVPVGIGKVLHATLTPDGFYDSTLDVVLPPASHCGMECLTSSDFRFGAPEEIEVVNRYGASSFYLTVGTYADPGSYSLDISVDDTPQGSVCETAVAITPGILYSQSLEGFYDSYDYPTSNCTGYGDFGPERVYSIVVPAGDTLTVSANPVPTLDISVYLIRGPAQNCRTDQECLVGADDAAEGEIETVSYRNTSGTAETMFIIVDMFDRTADPGSFTLTTTVGH
jgi:hypothetical protein